jgi:Na+-driven multidrug efflux pump
MLSVATVQGVLISLIIAGLGPYVPGFFTKDVAVVAQLKTLMPIVAAQQVIVSLTFVSEALAAGASQFSLLGVGTAMSALAAVSFMSRAKTILDIWTRGVMVMFVGRLIAAGLGVLNVNGLLPRSHRKRHQIHQKRIEMLIKRRQ